MKEIKISMKEVAEQMVIAYQNTTIEDYHPFSISQEPCLRTTLMSLRTFLVRS